MLLLLERNDAAKYLRRNEGERNRAMTLVL